MLMIIACITMLFDHIGFSLTEHETLLWIIFRSIGRIAMPVYAYQIAAGFDKTSNKQKYLERIAVLAIISQAPFYMIGNTGINICLVWLLSLLVLLCSNKKKEKLAICFIIITGIIEATLTLDYGLYGIFLVLFFYRRNKNKDFKSNIILITGMSLWLIADTIISFFSSGIKIFSIMQYCELLAVPIIMLCEKKNLVRINNNKIKTIYHWFYPAHMAVIAAIIIIKQNLGGD